MTVQLAEKRSLVDSQSFVDVFRGLIGQVITVVNPESYIPTLTGFKVDVETYKARVVSCDHGVLKILIEFLSDPHKKLKEKAYQFVPIDQIKRVMISKSEKLVSL